MAEIGERELEICNTKQFLILATGSGLVVVQVSWQYHPVKKDENKVFDLKVRVTTAHKKVFDLIICMIKLKGKETDMAIVCIRYKTSGRHKVKSESII